MNNAEIDSLAPGLQTVYDAQRLLGRATELVHEGYGQLGDVTSMAGAREEARSALDLVNQRLTQVYTELPGTGSQSLSAFERRRVAGAVLYARDSLRLVDSVKGSTLAELLDSAADAFKTVIGAASAGIWSLAVPLAIGAAAIFFLRRSA